MLLCSRTSAHSQPRLSCAAPARMHHAQTTELIDGIRKRTAHVPYDFLVVAVGARVNTFNIPGVREHCFFLKELADSRAIRQRILRNIEGARLVFSAPVFFFLCARSLLCAARVCFFLRALSPV